MILVDANVFMYAAGAPHKHKLASVNFLHDAARLRHECCLNAEVLQEILHRYQSIGRIHFNCASHSCSWAALA